MKKKPSKKKMLLATALRQINSQYEDWFEERSRIDFGKAPSWLSQKKYLGEKLNGYGLVSNDCLPAFWKAFDGLVELHEELQGYRGIALGWDAQSHPVLHGLLKWYKNWSK